MIANKNITEKSDLYSLGMTIIEIITLEIPYSDCDSTSQIIQKIKAGKETKEREESKRKKFKRSKRKRAQRKTVGRER